MITASRRNVYPVGWEQLREARERRGWTLVDLAEQTGVDYTRISRIERGAGGDEDTIDALCRALGLRFVPARIEP